MRSNQRQTREKKKRFRIKEKKLRGERTNWRCDTIMGGC